MLTNEDIKKANDGIKTIDVKGKKYVMVNERVRAFRNILPGGSIVTEIIRDDDEKVIMCAKVYDGDNLLATGTAFEMKDSSFINKTSYIENCETSAVGRALGFLGIGIDDSMGSADEIANAIQNQNEDIGKKVISEIKAQALYERCLVEGVDTNKLCQLHKIDSITKLTEAQHSGIINNWERVKATCGDNRKGR